MVTTAINPAQVMRWLANVEDPEIPVLSVVDLGIVRNVEIANDDAVTVSLTPTYSGCPATEVIEQLVVRELTDHGLTVKVRRVLSPAWTTDWLTDEGRRKLQDYGIAPPADPSGKRALLAGNRTIACPQCHSQHTTLISEFGSTACKAAYRCDSCQEPFEYFKCI